MKKKVEETNYNNIITLFFILALIFIRIYFNNHKYQNLIVGIINIFGSFYVLWRIHCQVKSFLKDRNTKSKLLEKSYNKYEKTIKILFFIFLIICFFYIFVIYKNEKIYNIFCSLINDCLALITLGISIEDELITKKITNLFKYLI